MHEISSKTLAICITAATVALVAAMLWGQWAGERDARAKAQHLRLQHVAECRLAGGVAFVERAPRGDHELCLRGSLAMSGR
ncbi:MAG: hypothetical protein RR101_14570 [Burkholderiaceae bacterium]